MRTLTPRILGEILQHEGLAREAYRDSVGVWTWSVGITDASGHRVARYRDNPQPLERKRCSQATALQGMSSPTRLAG